MSRNGVARTRPFSAMRICPACSTMKRRAVPSPTGVMNTGLTKSVMYGSAPMENGALFDAARVSVGAGGGSNGAVVGGIAVELASVGDSGVGAAVFGGKMRVDVAVGALDAARVGVCVGLPHATNATPSTRI